MATTTRNNFRPAPRLARSAKSLHASRPRQPQPMRWTHSQYHAMAEQGYFAGKRVELIGGEIIEMAPMRHSHWLASGKTEEVLRDVFATGFIITTRAPLRMPDSSEPEPDAAVIAGTWRDFISEIPTTAALGVEISDSTLRFDQTTKASLYAAAGVAEYWIVNLKARRLEVHRAPAQQARTRFGWAYREKIALQEQEVVSPLAAPEAQIKVADLLP